MAGLRSRVTVTGSLPAEAALVKNADGSAIASPVYADCTYDSAAGVWVCDTPTPNGTYGPGAQLMRLKGSNPPVTAGSVGTQIVAGGAEPAKAKKLVYLGDSLVNSVLTTTTRATARLNSTTLTTAVVSFPGEGARDFLNSHLAASAAAVDSTKDCYALVSEDTNGLNQYYIDQVKADALALANALLGQGYKGIVWMQVAACQSPYAYARDAQGNIIGTTTTDRQAGFDTARKAYNTYLQTLVGTKLYRVADLSVYPNVYTQANASDTRYFYAAGTGPYAGSEPGKVHFTDYGARYWAEAAAQAAAPMLGITLSPATVTIPDAPTTGPTYQANPYAATYRTDSPNASYVDGHMTKTGGGTGWNTNVYTDALISQPPTNTNQVTILFDQPRAGRESVIFGIGDVATPPVDGFAWMDVGFYYDENAIDIYMSGTRITGFARGGGQPTIVLSATQTAGVYGLLVKVGGFTVPGIPQTVALNFSLTIGGCLFRQTSDSGLAPSEMPNVSLGSATTLLR